MVFVFQESQDRYRYLENIRNAGSGNQRQEPSRNRLESVPKRTSDGTPAEIARDDCKGIIRSTKWTHEQIVEILRKRCKNSMRTNGAASPVTDIYQTYYERELAKSSPPSYNQAIVQQEQQNQNRPQPPAQNSQHSSSFGDDDLQFTIPIGNIPEDAYSIGPETGTFDFAKARGTADGVIDQNDIAILMYYWNRQKLEDEIAKLRSAISYEQKNLADMKRRNASSSSVNEKEQQLEGLQRDLEEKIRATTSQDLAGYKSATYCSSFVKTLFWEILRVKYDRAPLERFKTFGTGPWDYLGDPGKTYGTLTPQYFDIRALDTKSMRTAPSGTIATVRYKNTRVREKDVTHALISLGDGVWAHLMSGARVLDMKNQGDVAYFNSNFQIRRTSRLYVPKIEAFKPNIRTVFRSWEETSVNSNGDEIRPFANGISIEKFAAYLQKTRGIPFEVALKEIVKQNRIANLSDVKSSKTYQLEVTLDVAAPPMYSQAKYHYHRPDSIDDANTPLLKKAVLEYSPNWLTKAIPFLSPEKSRIKYLEQGARDYHVEGSYYDKIGRENGVDQETIDGLRFILGKEWYSAPNKIPLLNIHLPWNGSIPFTGLSLGQSRKLLEESYMNEYSSGTVDWLKRKFKGTGFESIGPFQLGIRYMDSFLMSEYNLQRMLPWISDPEDKQELKRLYYVPPSVKDRKKRRTYLVELENVPSSIADPAAKAKYLNDRYLERRKFISTRLTKYRAVMYFMARANYEEEKQGLRNDSEANYISYNGDDLNLTVKLAYNKGHAKAVVSISQFNLYQLCNQWNIRVPPDFYLSGKVGPKTHSLHRQLCERAGVNYEVSFSYVRRTLLQEYQKTRGTAIPAKAELEYDYARGETYVKEKVAVKKGVKDLSEEELNSFYMSYNLSKTFFSRFKAAQGSGKNFNFKPLLQFEYIKGHRKILGDDTYADWFYFYYH